MGRTIGLGRIWSFVLGFRSLVARLAPFKRERERVGTNRAKLQRERKCSITNCSESGKSLRISAPQWWPLHEGRDGKCEGGNEKCEFLARESAIYRQFERDNGDVTSVSGDLSVKGETGSVKGETISANILQGKVQIYRQFERDSGDVTSVSLLPSLSLSLSLSHRLYLTHNIGSASALPIIQN